MSDLQFIAIMVGLMSLYCVAKEAAVNQELKLGWAIAGLVLCLVSLVLTLTALN